MRRERKTTSQRSSYQDPEHYPCSRHHKQRLHVLPDLQRGYKGHRLPGLHVKPDLDVAIEDWKIGIAEPSGEIGEA